MLFLPALAVLLLQTATAPDSTRGAGARNPAYARDGRLAVSVQGDLWIVSKSGEWTRITSGPAWDREPAWTPDGSAIVFSSDRAGNFDLWRVAVGRAGAEPGPPSPPARREAVRPSEEGMAFEPNLGDRLPNESRLQRFDIGDDIR